jgi:cellulose synthase/poly-beta-1,6-N-acetylglucosamine synthase-like glycosyltransferase
VPLTVAALGSLSWFLCAWFLSPDARFSALTFWLVTFVFLYWFSVWFFRWMLLPLMSRPVPMRTQQKYRVGVATTFVPGTEPLAMLEMTVTALVAMSFPHDTWVLDEGDDPVVRAMCLRLGAKHFTRKHDPKYQVDQGTFERNTKHGNYNAWLDAEGYSSYDVIVGFDPDHIPDREFLNASLGYLDDPNVGYVQLPQVYYNQCSSFIARGAAEETYAYFSATQMSSYTAGFPIITGCHHVHRATALRQVGGFAAHDADDLLITLLYRAAGHQGVYVPEVHARGLAPASWPSYLQQQLRWSRAVVDIKLRAFPKMAGQLPAGTRLMSLLHGFYYMQEGVIGVVTFLLLVYFLLTATLPTFLSGSLVQNLAVVALTLTAIDSYRQKFFLQPEREQGLHLRARFLRAAKWPYLFFGLMDAVTGRKRPYTITPKVKMGRSRTPATWPHLLIAAALALSWLLGSLRGHHPPTLLAVVTLGKIGLALSIVWTESWDTPEPFDEKLFDAA